jgi:transcription initiation factor IIE alpha subunit
MDSEATEDEVKQLMKWLEKKSNQVVYKFYSNKTFTR